MYFLGLNLEEWAAVGTIIASLAVIFTVWFVWKQTNILQKNTDYDELRYRRESIIMLNSTLTSEEFRLARDKMLAKQDKSYGKMQDDTKQAFRVVLTTYGMLSRQIDHQALEEAMFKDFWETNFKRDCKKLASFVGAERMNKSNLNLFESFNKLGIKMGAIDES